MSVRPLSTDTNDLLLDIYDSNLKVSAVAGTGYIDIYSINNFAINNILLIGELGDEGSEIILTHTSTAPAGNRVTLASNLTKDHPKDTKVYVLIYDKIEWSNSSTETGSKTVLTNGLIDIDPESVETLILDSEYSSGFYFSRYKNSISSAFSSYSDPIPFGGFASNTVSAVVNLAMKEMNKDFSEKLTYEILIQETNACLRYIRGKLKTWSNTQEFDYAVDQMNRGEYKFTLPSTLYDKNSNRSILSVKVGQDRENLIYRDKREFDRIMEDTLVSTVYTQPSIGETSLVLTSTDDLPSSGSINIYTDNTLNTITYTANDKDTNTLSGIPASGDGSITATHIVGINTWSGEREGEPNYFTIYDGYLYIMNLINSTDAGQNIYMDFYTDIVEVDSDADELTLVRFDMIKHWLIWVIRAITENSNIRDLRDPDYIMFLTILNDSTRRESSGQKRKMKPKLNGIFYNRGSNKNPSNIWQ